MFHYIGTTTWNCIMRFSVRFSGFAGSIVASLITYLITSHIETYEDPQFSFIITINHSLENMLIVFMGFSMVFSMSSSSSSSSMPQSSAKSPSKSRSSTGKSLNIEGMIGRTRGPVVITCFHHQHI